MAKDLQKLAQAHVQTLVPYQSARRIGSHGHVLLNANESPKSELYFFNSTTLNRYPDAQPFEILQGYADYAGYGMRPNNIIVTRGSDEAIGLIVRTFSAPNEGIAIAPPTYGMYEIAARTNNAQVLYLDRDENLKLDIDGMIKSIKGSDFAVKVLFIDSPANPLGDMTALDDVRKLLEALPETLIVMDEAYIEFAPEKTTLSLLKDYNNLIVLRTLSKAFALAGIRCGFALGHETVIQLLNKVIDPYPMPDPVVQIARQALANGGIDLMKARVALCLKRRYTLEAALLSLPCVKKIFPSEANFLLVRFDNGPAVFDFVARKGITLRSFEGKKGLDNTIRISIGSDEELDELMRALTAYCASGV